MFVLKARRPDRHRETAKGPIPAVLPYEDRGDAGRLDRVREVFEVSAARISPRSPSSREISPTDSGATSSSSSTSIRPVVVLVHDHPVEYAHQAAVHQGEQLVGNLTFEVRL